MPLLTPNTLLRGLLLLCGIAAAATAQLPCPAGQYQFAIDIQPDQYPQETTWQLTDYQGHILATGDTTDTALCVPAAQCLQFTIFDAYGDGICCAYGQGSYTVWLDGAVVASGGQFQSSATAQFGCQPGQACATALAVGPLTGTQMAPFPEAWFAFTPDSTGIYEISTCGLASCNTALWVYDHCQNLVWDSTNIGTIAFADSGCAGGGGAAEITTILAAGQQYFIRVGDVGGSCGTGSIPWQLSYVGPVVGCTDPASCTYNPLATVADTAACVYWGEPGCAEAPDLWMVQDQFVNTLQMDTIANADFCLVQEGCITGYGTRYVLRFDTRIENIGQGDYYIGEPPADPSIVDPQWEWDPCHNHWHYEGYAEYVLYDAAGIALPVGYKNGFCVMDLDCSLGGGQAKYNCNNMGISANCGDIYGAYLACQWIDITDVDTGQYTLVIRVNWDQSKDKLGRVEADFANNWAQACIRINRYPSGVPYISLDTTCVPFVDCAGQIYGGAQPDCMGQCAGVVLTGDVDADTARTHTDVGLYLDASLPALPLPIAPTACTDLDGSGQIDVYDAALSLDCAIRGENWLNPSGGGIENHCLFPHHLANPAETTLVSLGPLIGSAGYVDVQVHNDMNRVLALQMRLEGVRVDSVASLVPYLDADFALRHDTLGNIAALALDEQPLDKNLVPVPVLRVFFSQIHDSVCIGEIAQLVNDRYERVQTQAGACQAVQYPTGMEAAASRPCYLRPNPAREEAILYLPEAMFPGAAPGGLGRGWAAAWEAQIAAPEGRLWKVQPVYGAETRLDLRGAAPGVYTVRVAEQTMRLVVLP